MRSLDARSLQLGVWIGVAAVGNGQPPAADLLPPPLIEPTAGVETDERASGATDPAVEGLRSILIAGGEPSAGNVAEPLLERLRAEHPWGRFPLGAWRRVRVIAEAFDANGGVVSSSASVRTERLIALDRETYTLEVENGLPVAGQSAATPPVRSRAWLATDQPYEGGAPEVQPLPPTSISLGEVVVPCCVLSFHTRLAGAEETVTVTVAPSGAPAVMRREAVTLRGSLPGPTLLQTLTARDLPLPIGQKLAPSWRLVTLLTQPDGAKTVAESVVSGAIPGGVHSERSTDYNAAGDRLRWVATELLDWGTAAESDRDPAEAVESPGEPSISIEVRPRRFLRVLRREDRSPDPGI